MKKQPVTVYNTRNRFVLRPEVLSLTLGIFWSCVVFIFTLAAMVDGKLSGLPEILAGIYPGYGLYGWSFLAGIGWAFLSGYLLGYFIGLMYIVLPRRQLRKKSSPLFRINTDQNANVIQEGVGKDPYTIVFVANPYVLPLEGDGRPMVDPIINNHGLFLKTVTRCLRSFLGNELMRQPDIFQQMRFITVFDHDHKVSEKNTNEALCEGVSLDTSALAPRRVRRDDNGNVNKNFVLDYVLQQIENSNIKGPLEIDVIAIISADHTYTRSAARFSEDNPNRGGKRFTFTFFEPGTAPQEKYHYRYANVPGMFALSAWDDRLKTPVHEFAHAMSDIDNGAIDDEYIDESHAALEFRVNKKFRGGFMVSDWMANELADLNYDKPEDQEFIGRLIAPNTGIKCEVFDTQQAFLNSAQAVINNDEVFSRYRETILKLARFRTVFRLDSTALANLQPLLPTEVFERLDSELPRLNKDFIDKKEFLDELKDVLKAPRDNGNKDFEKYKLLILRFANVHNYAIPREFARYRFNGAEKVYDSDRKRGDKEMHWVSYTPARSQEHTTCIMDSTSREYRFDQLVFDFMYDRLMTKIERNHLTPQPCERA